MVHQMRTVFYTVGKLRTLSYSEALIEQSKTHLPIHRTYIPRYDEVNEKKPVDNEAEALRVKRMIVRGYMV